MLGDKPAHPPVTLNALVDAQAYPYKSNIKLAAPVIGTGSWYSVTLEFALVHNSVIQMTASTAYAPLATVLVNDQNTLARNIMLAVAGSIALWISAKVQVPFLPVPMTLQTLVVLIIGMAYGWRLGAATIALYLAQGAAGLPVFAGTPEKGIGLAYMVGPTGGFLIGFVLAAIAVGYLAERGWDRNIVSTAGAMLIGNALIYIPGLFWLSTLTGWDKAIEFGIKPFLLGDLFKLVLAALFMPLIWNTVKKMSEDK